MISSDMGYCRNMASNGGNSSGLFTPIRVFTEIRRSGIIREAP